MPSKIRVSLREIDMSIGDHHEAPTVEHFFVVGCWNDSPIHTSNQNDPSLHERQPYPRFLPCVWQYRCRQYCESSSTIEYFDLQRFDCGLNDSSLAVVHKALLTAPKLKHVDLQSSDEYEAGGCHLADGFNECLGLFVRKRSVETIKFESFNFTRV